MKELAVLMPTLAREDINNLEYLQLAVESFLKCSSTSKLYIHSDGKSSLVRDWLDSKGVEYVSSEWSGQAQAFNKLARLANEKWMFTAHDDLVFSPKWDIQLVSWLKEDTLVTPWLVEPQNFDFGKTPNEFNETAFLEFAEKNAKHESLPRGSFLTALSRQLFLDMGGYDENLFPYGLTDADFYYRIVQNRPQVENIRIMDSILYHFSRAAKKKFEEHIKEYSWNVIGQSRDEYFHMKHGVTVGEAAIKLRERWGNM